MPKLGLGSAIDKKVLTTPGVLTTGRSVWAPLHSPNESSLSPELIHNGTFENNLKTNGHDDVDWITQQEAVGGTSRWTVEDEKLKHTATGDGSGNEGIYLYPVDTGTVRSGGLYKFTCDLIITAGNAPYAKVGNLGTTVQLNKGIGATTYLTAGTATSHLIFIDAHNSATFTLDNISLKHVTSYTGQALEFDGVTDLLTAKDVTSIYDNLGIDRTFTVSCWAKADTTTTGYVWNFYKDGNHGFGLKVASGSNNVHIVHDIAGALDTTYYLTSGHLKWAHYVVVVEDLGITLYRDGVVLGNDQSMTEGLSGDDYTIRIGARNGQSEQPFSGMMSNFQIWDKAWSASDVRYAFDNQEKLISANPSSSLTYSDLKLWYPMNDKHRGQDSYIMDGANTGLGSEIWANASDAFTSNNAGNGTDCTITHSGTEYRVMCNDSAGDTSGLAWIKSGALTENRSANTPYKITFTAKKDSDNGTIRLALNGSAVYDQAITQKYADYTFYLPQDTNGIGTTDCYLSLRELGTRESIYIKDISIKAISNKHPGNVDFFGDQLWNAEGHSSNVGTFTNGSGELRNGGGSATEIASGTLVNHKWYEISARDGVDFTDYGAPNNNVGTVFCLNHDDGSSVPTMDSNDKVYLIDLNWVPHDSHALHIDSNALYMAYDATGTPGTNGATLDLKSAADLTANLTPGSHYKFTCDAKVGDGDSVVVALHDGNASNTVATVENHADYAEISCTFVAHHATDCYIRTQSMGSGEEIWLDNMSLKEVGFADGWTSAHSQPVIPQLAFQNYNELVFWDGYDARLDAGTQSIGTNDWSWSFWFIADDDHERIMSAYGPVQVYMSSGFPRVTFYDDQFNSGTPVEINPEYAKVNDGKLHHCALTWDRDGYFSFYIDGTRHGRHDVSAISGETITSGNIYLGRANTTYGAGVSTELSTWQHALTQAEVLELFNDGVALDARYHSKASLLTGYWKGDSNGTWPDLSTNSNNATASAGEVFVLPEGESGGVDILGIPIAYPRTSGLNFPVENGSSTNDYNGYIDLGVETSISAGTAFSVTAWVKPRDIGNSSETHIIGSGSDYIRISDTNSVHVYSHSGTPTQSTLDLDSGTYAQDEWVHIGLVRNASNLITLYVNGAAQSDTETHNNIFRYRYLANHGTAANFRGGIDDIAVYKATELSAAQVKRNYNAGKRRHQN